MMSSEISLPLQKASLLRVDCVGDDGGHKRFSTSVATVEWSSIGGCSGNADRVIVLFALGQKHKIAVIEFLRQNRALYPAEVGFEEPFPYLRA